MSKKNCAKLSVVLQAFFTDYLISQRSASEHTIASYRDAFRILLQYAQTQLKKAPSTLTLDDLNASFIRGFLKHLEKTRGVSVRSRNQRLAAIRSCFRYSALQSPDKGDLIQQVLAIPNKRHERPLIDFLTEDETDVLLAAPDQRSWAGRRDHALLLFDIQTGLRVSELTGLRRSELTITVGAHVRCFGKGRKERCTPLTKQTAEVLKAWLRECEPKNDSIVFTNRRGGRLSTDGVQYILDKYVQRVAQQRASFRKKRVTPHVLRHTAAMRLVQAGVDRTTVALWLGHESIETTQVYIDADMKMKEEALRKISQPRSTYVRFKATDQLLAFLDSL